MTYIQDVVDAVDAAIPSLTPAQARVYALLVLIRGERITAHDVHDARAVAEADADHPSLVPWEQLTRSERVKDQPFAKALRRVAYARKDPEERVLRAVVEAYRAGYSIRAIGARHRLSYHAVHRMLTGAGVPLHPSGWPRGQRPECDLELADVGVYAKADPQPLDNGRDRQKERT